jgi:hypothetical protein
MRQIDSGAGREKVAWAGVLVGVQPRIRLTRSFDQRHHSYLGYSLSVQGTVEGGEREFSLGIGKAVQAKHSLRAGDRVSGLAVAVADPRREAVDLYRLSALRVEQRGAESKEPAPPWQGEPPALEVYRARGHRRLDPRTYRARCQACIWGCRMPVELILDQWRPEVKRYRFETFCYGPKSCARYRAGPTRKVPGRRGMQWEEEDWVDEEATAHRGPDD